MKIYVSNLNYSVTDEQLNQLFEMYGEVNSAKVILDRETKRSRGFGFVEMNNDEEASKAIALLNKSEHVGKVLNVSVAKPREEGTGGSKGSFGNKRFKR